MSKPSTAAKGALSALAAVMALAAAASAPQAASAQPYGYYGQGAPGGAYYDPCRRDQNGRGIVGALIGGALGATLGSQVAASGHRTDGSLLGGGLGAIGGAVVGSHSAACAPGSQYYGAPPPPPPPPQAYYQRGYDAPPPPPPEYRWGSRYDEDRWAYGARGQRFRIAERPVDRNGCTLAESPIYLPDGRVEKRFVRVCQDETGRFRVVD
jgi:opacity protein-like surface antigen